MVEVESSVAITETEIEETQVPPEHTPSELQKSCRAAAKRGSQQMALLSEAMDAGTAPKLRRTKGGPALAEDDKHPPEDSQVDDPPKEDPPDF